MKQHLESKHQFKFDTKLIRKLVYTFLIKTIGNHHRKSGKKKPNLDDDLNLLLSEHVRSESCTNSSSSSGNSSTVTQDTLRRLCASFINFLTTANDLRRQQDAPEPVAAAALSIKHNISKLIKSSETGGVDAAASQANGALMSQFEGLLGGGGQYAGLLNYLSAFGPAVANQPMSALLNQLTSGASGVNQLLLPLMMSQSAAAVAAAANTAAHLSSPCGSPMLNNASGSGN